MREIGKFNLNRSEKYLKISFIFLFIVIFLSFSPFVQFLAGQSKTNVSVHLFYKNHLSVILTEPYKNQWHEAKPENILSDLIAGAKKSVKMMIFDLDMASLINSLLEAEKRGIDIEIIIDPENTPPEIQDILIQENWAVEYNPARLMHHKILIIDDQILAFGSMNYTVNGIYFNNNDLFLLSLLPAENYDFLSGSLLKFEHADYETDSGNTKEENASDTESIIQEQVKNIIDYFIEYFDVLKNEQKTGRVKFYRPGLFFLEKDPLTIILTRFILEGENEIYKEANDYILSFLNTAEKRIGFSYSTFTNWDIAQSMIRRVEEKKLDFLGVLEYRNTFSQYSAFSLFEKANMNIFKDNNESILHHKFAIIDDWILTGSYAIADRSNKTGSKYNDDLLVIFRNRFLADFFYTYIYSLIPGA